ncbi:VOC family protein [Demequina sp. SYSU T00068]|uniref:VOC family protein n=1 Tax=Demequina lignilytica TaxID=3051663 RepID=UPI002627AC01|nr:VOC family protein [Demequina sp. SYSU T00068]MDN4491005.1 VOC family protein [Demequina sp. SYSU T00068]
MNAPSRRRTSLIILSAIVLLAVGVTVGTTMARSSDDGVPPVAALPGAAGMGEVELLVADLAPMVEFYAGGVGLEVIEQTSETAVLGADGEALVRIVRAPGLGTDDPGEAGLYHSAFLFADASELASAVVRVATASPEAFQGASDHTVSNAFYFADPEGNGVELYVDLPRDTWTWTDGRVTMGTYALDPNAFLAEHLPASGPTLAATGVAMGHVHLRGGDVDAAERFYVDVIGMAVTSRIDSAVFLSAGGYHHHLAVNTWSSAGAGERPEALGLGHLTVTVPDAATVDAVEARARAAGAVHERTVDGLTVLDPWGTQVVVRVAA